MHREYGRRGALELRRTIDLYASEAAWPIFCGSGAATITLPRPAGDH